MESGCLSELEDLGSGLFERRPFDKTVRTVAKVLSTRFESKERRAWQVLVGHVDALGRCRSAHNGCHKIDFLASSDSSNSTGSSSRRITKLDNQPSKGPSDHRQA